MGLILEKTCDTLGGMKKFILGLRVGSGALMEVVGKVGLMNGVGLVGIMVVGVMMFGVVFGTDVVMAEEVAVGEGEVVSGGLPEIYIKSVNPGYTVDGVGNVGEMIEISKNSSDDKISLAGATVGYTNSSGNYSVLVEFPENSWITGEFILLQLASSPSSELADLTYAKTLAFKGGLDIRRGDEIIDSVCWTGKGECYKEFKSALPTTLVRKKESGSFEHLADYTVEYGRGGYMVESEDAGYGGEEVVMGHCKGLEFSEMLSYYESSREEQFIEIYNRGSEQVLMDGCAIRYKNKKYTLSGILPSEGYRAYYPTEFSLTKNPTNGNLLELVDVDGVVLDELFYPNGQRKGTAYAFVGYDGGGEEIWKVTYAPTPGAPNNYQEFKSCEAGKVINEATGNCVKVATVTEKICPEGQYLNILTGRCKKNTVTTEKTCKEGYYLNPETGRCRKVVENTGASYDLVPENYEEKSSFVALYAVLAVIGVGTLYIIYEFRREIGGLVKKVMRIR